MTVESNEEFMRRILSYGCPTGPLIHCVVFEGLRRYCESVVAKPASAFDTPICSGEAWQRTAQWLGEEIGKRLNMPFPQVTETPVVKIGVFRGFITLDGVQTTVEFSAPSNASREEKDSAFLDALAQVAEGLDYLEIGSEEIPN